jgi:hypothetical protein
MVIIARRALAHMLAAAGRPSDAIAEFEGVRPLLTAAHGSDSPQIHTIDRAVTRLRQFATPRAPVPTQPAATNLRD